MTGRSPVQMPAGRLVLLAVSQVSNCESKTMNKIISNLQNKLGMLNPEFLTGPVLGKELRVLSRRRRLYVVRFLYIVALTVFVSMAWTAATATNMFGSGLTGGTAYMQSRMSIVGQAVVSSVIWTQFVILSLMAINITSSAIGSEIRQRTLGILLTTPISSLQIVLGKLFGGLLQLVLLLAVSLPLLAIVRVLGGVQWGYVVSGLCITLTTMLFLGSLGILMSITTRKPRAAASRCFFFLVFVYWILPALLSALNLWAANRGVSVVKPSTLAVLFSITDPAKVMMVNTARYAMSGQNSALLFGVSGASFGSAISSASLWWYHCLVMLFISGVIVALTSVIVRRVALRQINTSGGEIKVNRLFSFWKRRSSKAASRLAHNGWNKSRDDVVCHVKGSPIIWREFIIPFVRRHRVSKILTVIVIGMAVIAAYTLGVISDSIRFEWFHTAFLVGYMMLGCFIAGNSAAAAIVSERESGTWLGVMMTPMGAGKILWDKALSIVLRLLPVWVLMVGHIIVFSLLGYIHPVALLLLIVPLISGLAYFVGLGLMFSSSAKSSSSAMNRLVGVTLLIMLIFPSCMTPLMLNGGITGFFFNSNPIVQVGVVAAGASGQKAAHRNVNRLRFPWVGAKSYLAGCIVRELITFVVCVLAVWQLSANITLPNVHNRRRLFDKT